MNQLPPELPIYDELKDIEKLRKLLDSCYKEVVIALATLAGRESQSGLSLAEKRSMKKLNIERSMVYDIQAVLDDFKERIEKINQLKDE